MDVFLVPVGPARYELYSEQADAALGAEPDGPPRGLLGRARRAFGEMLLAAADRERDRRDGRLAEPQGWSGRLRDRATAWVAERVAEQQLHWSLRHIEHAVLVHPDDLAADSAMATVRNALAHDRRWHGRWAVVHGVLFAASGLVAVIPGPNLLAYYFAFRLVGHWLSRRGAVQGADPRGVDDAVEPRLAEIGDVMLEPPAARHARLAEIAGRLDLRDLPAFVERMRLRRA